MTNIFTQKSTRILRALLSNTGDSWTERDLAREASVSSGTAHYTTRKLIDLGYLDRNNANRIVVVDPVRLLRRWAAFNQYDNQNTFLDFHTFDRNVEAFLERLKSIGEEYALTALTGAWLVAPHVRPMDVHFYVPDQKTASKIERELDIKPTPRLGNVKMVLPFDDGVFYGKRSVGNLYIVSDIQLYIDLYNYPSRGEEAALKVFNKIIEGWHEGG